MLVNDIPNMSLLFQLVVISALCANSLSMGDSNNTSTEKIFPSKTEGWSNFVNICFFIVIISDIVTASVNLSRLQNLMIDQILDVYALSGPLSPICKNDTLEFKRGLRNVEPWALQSEYTKKSIKTIVLL